MKVVSWFPVLTDHLSYTLEALQEAGQCDLKVYVANSVHVERQSQGWVNQHVSLLSPELIPQKRWVKFVIQRLRENQDAVHLFGSPFEQMKMIFVLLLALAQGHRVFLISEPYAPVAVGYQNDRLKLVNWIKSKLRPLLYRLYGIIIRYRIEGVFAISCLAVEQYQVIGIPRNKIFPFGYFIPSQNLANSGYFPTKNSENKKLKLVFIGNLISRKGLDLLITAVKEVNSKGLSLSLDVYGPGDSNIYDFDQSVVRYSGLIPFGDSQAVILKYDMLVLPSRFDGWGVVVNEALMAGVPVICSNQVGASGVLDKWQCGITFMSEDVSDLVDKLKKLLIHTELLNSMRIGARKAGASLEPKIAGHYMNNIIRQGVELAEIPNKYECPWYDC